MKHLPIIAFGLALAATPALAADATFTTIDIEGVFTVVTGLNNHAATTGLYLEADLSTHGFLRTPDGTVTKFDIGGAQTRPSGINEDDTVTGTYADPETGESKGFVRAADGTITTFDPSSGGGTFPVAINNKGQIAGYYIDADGNQSGFVRSAKGKVESFTHEEGGLTPNDINRKGLVTGTVSASNGLGFLHAKDGTTTTFVAAADAHGTESNAINDTGWTAGRYLTAHFKTRGFLRDPEGNVTTVNVRDARRTSVLAINADHAAAGRWDDATTNHSFLRRASGHVVAFDPPGALSSLATEINDDGVVAGTFQAGDDVTRSYIRTP